MLCLEFTISKNHLIRTLAFVVLFSLIFLCSGCSAIRAISGFSNAPTGIRDTLSQLTRHYLSNIVSGRSEMVTSMRSCPAPCNVSNNDIILQIKEMQQLTKGSKHPLSNFAVSSVKTNENRAHVILTNRFKSTDLPDIEIECFWGGAGWFIVDDNIFGASGFASYLKNRNN